MQIVKYGTVSRFGFETQASEEEHKKHMKFLHIEKASFTPFVLVEGAPGEIKAIWLKQSEYRRLLKKEGEAC